MNDHPLPHVVRRNGLDRIHDQAGANRQSFAEFGEEPTGWEKSVICTATPVLVDARAGGRPQGLRRLHLTYCSYTRLPRRGEMGDRNHCNPAPRAPGVPHDAATLSAPCARRSPGWHFSCLLEDRVQRHADQHPDNHRVLPMSYPVRTLTYLGSPMCQCPRQVPRGPASFRFRRRGPGRPANLRAKNKSLDARSTPASICARGTGPARGASNGAAPCTNRRAVPWERDVRARPPCDARTARASA
jgi:hypothetical protein